MRKTTTILTILLSLSICSSAQYSLVINELDYDQFNPSADSAEFIELYNNGTAPINLSDFIVVGINGAAGGAVLYRTFVLPTYQLNSGSRYVICGNGGFVPLCNQVENVFSNMIQNGSPDAIAILHVPDSTVVDALSYEGTVPGYSDGNGVPLA
ncbi:MAG: lamin tail domain-containing protein, partial [Bacteroidota bacterium]